MFNGLPERLTKDMKSLAPYSIKEEIVREIKDRKYILDVNSLEKRKNSALLAAQLTSIFTSHSDVHITKIILENGRCQAS